MSCATGVPSSELTYISFLLGIQPFTAHSSKLCLSLGNAISKVMAPPMHNSSQVAFASDCTLGDLNFELSCSKFGTTLESQLGSRTPTEFA